MAYEPAVSADLVLRDGRRIAYGEWGDRSGWPIILCHGAPGSRLFGPDSKTTAEAGVRLITADRPGYGGSDPQPGRQIRDWPVDVEELTAALSIDEFDVAGHSSGGPYALACASTFPGRVKRVALISCIAPYGEPSSEQADDDEELTRLACQDLGRAAEEIAKSAAWLVETPERFSTCPGRNRTCSSSPIRPSAACSSRPSGKRSSRAWTHTAGIAHWSVGLGALPPMRSAPTYGSFRVNRTGQSRHRKPASWPRHCRTANSACSPTRVMASFSATGSTFWETFRSSIAILVGR